MRIGVNTVGMASKMISDLLVTKGTIEKLNQGLLCTEDESITVAIKVKFSPGERKPVAVDVTMTFPVEKHKAGLKDEIDERQMSLVFDADFKKDFKKAVEETFPDTEITFNEKKEAQE